MKKNSKLFSLLFLTVSAAIGLSYFMIPDRDISLQERRRLTAFPNASLESVLDGSFEKKLESYLLDQNPFRNVLLSLQSAAVRDLFFRQDDRNIISHQGYLTALEQVMDEESIQKAARLFASIYEKHLADTECRVYLSIIPDKGYFVQDPSYAFLDYEALILSVTSKLPQMDYISLTDCLNLEDYYKTDSHWNQIYLKNAAAKLAQAMHRTWDDNYETRRAADAFLGVYASQSGWPVSQESLDYLWNADMENYRVISYETGKPQTVSLYDFEKLKGMDPYAFFLQGNPGMITIENDNAPKGELIVFRDSFGSSIAPLLAQSYSKITLIDLRNLPSSLLDRYVDFSNQDVLFLYSTTQLNASSALK
ncbi:MAG: hypothetical protein HUJ55_08130 [Ileibacterium sp.]|nr:hypothetical protein [Ileibacterium sp.]